MRHILKQFTQREAHPGIQFIKYAIAGGIATMVDMLTFFLAAWLLIPALGPDERLVQLFHITVAPISDVVRSQHYVADVAIAFLFSNTSCYIINALWVFHPGRHSRWKEFTLFCAVSFTSVLVGTVLGWVLIRWFGLGTVAAYAAKMFASLAINFVGRKFFVFLR